MKRCFYLSLVALAACSSESPVAPEASASFATSANANSLRVETFTGVAPTTCNAYANEAFLLSYTIGQVPGIDCRVGVPGPGDGNAGGILTPHIEGSAAGALRIDFDKPTRTVEFDLAQSFGTNTPPTFAVVKLFKPGAGVLREEVRLLLTKDPLFVAGRFTYTGGAVKSVEITFERTAARFALDNLMYYGKN